ncbi:MAG: shikimate dehydrogenase family protein [Alphaproteobacteria bacterium]
MKHVRVPELYNAKFQERGFNVAVVPVQIRNTELPHLIEMARAWRNLVGIGVTIPHKEIMVGLVDELTSTASLCGATNVVRRDEDGRLVGTQMDGPGFVLSLRKAGIEPANRRALIIGAGGTAKAIACELAAQGPATLTITNRTVARAEALAERVSTAFPNCHVDASSAASGEFDLIVNATSLGMKDTDPLPVDPALLSSTVVVADVVMSPAETNLLREARRRGCQTHPGLLMLEAQFDATVDFLKLTPQTEDAAVAQRHRR